MVAPDDVPIRSTAALPGNGAGVNHHAHDVHDHHGTVSSTAQPSRDEQEQENDASTWRKQLGRQVVSAQHSIDANLTLVRVGCIAVMLGSAYAAVRFSGVLGRFRHVDHIPSYYFRQRKTLRVRVIRQSHVDPSIFYVYHTPFLRRMLLQDRLPPVAIKSTDHEPLLAVRAFGIQVDECANEWVYSNVVSTHRYVDLRLLRRLATDTEGHESIATCVISIRKFPFKTDLAHELVSRGLAECLPEDLDKYADGSTAVQPFVKRLQQLEAAQKNAQTMRYGIWKDWQDDNLTDRVLSAGKRLTSRGFQKLVGKTAD